MVDSSLIFVSVIPVVAVTTHTHFSIGFFFAIELVFLSPNLILEKLGFPGKHEAVLLAHQVGRCANR
jgi:hypothetical protein